MKVYGNDLIFKTGKTILLDINTYDYSVIFSVTHLISLQ